MRMPALGGGGAGAAEPGKMVDRRERATKINAAGNYDANAVYGGNSPETFSPKPFSNAESPAQRMARQRDEREAEERAKRDAKQSAKEEAAKGTGTQGGGSGGPDPISALQAAVQAIQGLLEKIEPRLPTPALGV